MGSIEEIIVAIDDHLLQKRKDYLSLGSANQLLFDLGIISDSERLDKTLKNLLEENKIPHAYKTENSPKQWRIPLSEYGKIRKSKNKKKSSAKNKSVKTRQLRPYYDNPVLLDNQQNQTICPGCGIGLSIPDNLLKYPYFQCPTCGVDFKNPFKVDQKETTKSLTKKQRNWIIAIVVIIAICIFGYILDKQHPNPNLCYIKADTYAALSQEANDQLNNYIYDNDKQAISSLLHSGQVIILQAGTDVYVEDRHLTYTIIRIKGTTQRLWVVSGDLEQR